MSGSLELPPLRNLNDFLMESARFQLPNFNDLEKWGNRVVKNLLYYQTNYFLMAVLFFAVMAVIHPIKIIAGILYIVGLVIIVIKFMPGKKQPKQDVAVNSYLIIGGLGLVGWLFLYFLDAILIVSFTFLVPFCATFVHSSLRQRNIKNKVANAMENLGVTNTPMGVFLDVMALNPDAISNVKPDIFSK